MDKIKKILKYFIALIIAIALTFSLLALDIYVFSLKTTHTNADAVIILGAAAWYKRPSPVFRERIQHGINLLKNKRAKYIIFTGGYGKGSKYSEAFVARQYALSRGISTDKIIIEEKSRITEENIYYALEQAKKYNLKSFILVSDPLHMRRSMAIAKRYKALCYSSPTPTTKFRSFKSKMNFLMREAYYYFLFILRSPTAAAQTPEPKSIKIYRN